MEASSKELIKNLSKEAIIMHLHRECIMYGTHKYITDRVDVFEMFEEKYPGRGNELMTEYVEFLIGMRIALLVEEGWLRGNFAKMCYSETNKWNNITVGEVL